MYQILTLHKLKSSKGLQMHTVERYGFIPYALGTSKRKYRVVKHTHSAHREVLPADVLVRVRLK